MIIRRYVIPYSIIIGGAILMWFCIVWSYPADAATLRIGTKDYTISAQTVSRIRAFAEANYACLPPTTDNECPPNPSPLNSMYDAILQGIKDNVRRWEAEKAIKEVPAPVELD